MQRRQKIINNINKFLKFLDLRVSNQSNADEVLKFINRLKVQNLGYELVRIGPEGDGGYLLPNILDEIDYCFSPGVGQINKFEEHLNSFGIKSFLADGTKNRPETKFQDFEFLKKNLSSICDESHITLDKWINDNNMSNNKNLILQMDIEGSEYEVINSTSIDSFKKFKVLVIEFHYFEQILNEFSFINIQNALNKILYNFKVCHIHPNNCCGVHYLGNIDIPSVLEITFLRKDLLKETNSIDKLPHKLDRKHKSKFPEINLSKIWYQS
jgi:hypothetical protein|tara:strand:+ start:351 stop:1157 length:807 start_codon:yes stop_codon:yes gene_type:complete